MKSSIAAHEKANLVFVAMLGTFIVMLLYGIFALGYGSYIGTVSNLGGRGPNEWRLPVHHGDRAWMSSHQL